MESISNTLLKVKSSKQWKFMNDKAKAALVGLDETKTAIIKALNHEYRPPKEKHVQKLIQILHHPDTNMGDVVTLISTTMHKTTSWIVAIKGLQVFHRLIQEGNERFVASIVKLNASKILAMRDWKDPSPSSKAFVQTPFIRSYSAYLEQRVTLYRITAIKGLSPKYVYPTGLAETFKVLTNLQLVLQCILDCVLSEDLIDNSSSLNAVSMLLKDSMLTYKLLSDGIIKLLDVFFKMELPNSKEALVIYEKHLNQTTQLITFYDGAKKLNGIIGNKLPSLTTPPDTFLKQMKKYVDDPKGYISKESKDSNIDDIPTQDISNLIGEEEMSHSNLWNEDSPKKNFDDILGSKTEDPFKTTKPNSNPFGEEQDDPFHDPFAKQIQPQVQQQQQQQQQQYPRSQSISFDPNRFEPMRPGQQTQQPQPIVKQQQPVQTKKDDPFDFLSGITKTEEKKQNQDPFATQTQDPFSNDPFF
jgi:hypothetical protein